jgi:hypothetical protein
VGDYKVTAEAIGVDPRTIRTYIRNGELEAKSEGEGVEKAYLVDIESVYELRASRKSSGKIRGRIRANPRTRKSSAD